MKLKATKNAWCERIAPKLASNFIELGYGLQVEGMAAEMFFNRSFEPFYPYRLINKLWYDLFEDENDLTSRCEDDWRAFDWYHSSYEHNAWFAFPGVAGHQRIDDDSTFVIEASPTADVRIKIVPEGCHGEHAMRVTNGSDGDGGLAQDGKYCFADTGYSFRGRLHFVEGEGTVRVAVYREGTVTDPVAVTALGEVGCDYTEVTARFTVPAEGRYTFVLLIPPHTAVLCDDFSLTPDDSVGKWKKQAVEAAAYVAPHVVRWPGGCFSSFYNWRDGVGAYRPPMKSYFWGGMQYNDIGTDELASFAEAIGSESMVCLNVHHPFKRFYEYVAPDHLDHDPNDGSLTWPQGAPHGRDLPHFADKEQGAKEAAAWVEYCNGDEHTEGGRARIANGRKKPYNVKYWEIDNEIHRWFAPAEYAETCVLYARTMKAVDPEVKIGMVSYCYEFSDLVDMLEIAGGDIDFFADRGFDEGKLERKLNLIDTYNKAHGTHIKYCNTEWLPLDGADVYNMAPRKDDKRTKCYLFSKWGYALDAASNLMMWQRHGDIIDFINFNNFANTHAQSAIETAKEGSFVTAAGEMLRMFATTRASRPLVCETEDGVYHPERNDDLQLQLSLTEEGDALVLGLLNRSAHEETLCLDLAAYNVADRGEGTVLTAPDSLSMNTLTRRDIRKMSAEVTVKDGRVEMTVEPLSYGEYIIPIK